MELVLVILGCLVGGGIGFGLGVWFSRREGQTMEGLTARLLEENERRFAQVSWKTLGATSEQLVRLAVEKLEAQQKLGTKDLEERRVWIDRELQRLNSGLEKMTETVVGLEKDREQKFGRIEAQLLAAAEQTTALRETTGSLKEALASARVRGNWGERMVEDILRVAGMLEHINYRKQQTLENGRRPDFTFLMPRRLELNLDSKFPLDNYVRAVEAQSPTEAETYRRAFLKDVRLKIRECAGRDYIHEGTVDYVLLFIPNEALYAYIHEADPRILDEALESRVIPCSPLTLYAVISVVRQAIDNFALERKSKQILGLLERFRDQWSRFTEGLEKVGRRLADAQKEFESLTTTRRRKLEVHLSEIDELRSEEPEEIGREPLSVVSAVGSSSGMISEPASSSARASGRGA